MKTAVVQMVSIFLCLFAACFWTGAAPAVAENAPRPKVGLVLGGGGALGLAHIGVLKALEEQRIPIDYIGGTSMGSIIAGCYASGMSPDEMQTWLESLDWDEVMSDATPRRELDFRRKLDDQRYLFEMGLNWKGPKMGTGLAAGQKFNNLLQIAVLRSAGISDFDRLPIPYRAVATDLESGTALVLDHGNLATAMRASMAVPGVFTAVEWEGRMLIDGGIVKNLPVDVVRAMGADILIAVDVGADSDVVEPATLKSLGGILSRTYSIAQRPGQIEQYRTADIGIQPKLVGLTAGDFDRVSEFVPRGEEAARGQADALSKLAVGEAEYGEFLAKQRRPKSDAITIGDVAVSGNRRVSEGIIRGKIRTKSGEMFDEREMQLDLMRIYGVGEFEQVLFRLDPGEEGRRTLRYDVKEKSWGPLYLSYGFNLRTDLDRDTEWAMLLNVTRRSLNALGAEWKNEIEVGSRQRVFSEFYQPLSAGGILFLAPTVEYRSETEAVYEGKTHVADYDVRQAEASLEFGIQLRRFAEFRIGPVWGTGKADVGIGATNLPAFDEDYSGWKMGLVVDRQDRTLFAREGYYLAIQGVVARDDLGGDADFDKMEGVLRKLQSFGDHTITFGLQGGTSLGSDLPGYAQFKLGGPFGFAGLTDGQFRGSYLGVASLGYGYRLLQLPSQLGKAVYAMARFDVGNVWADKIDTDDLRYGAAVGLGADLSIGPLYVAYGHADEGYDCFYFSLGTVF
jgi:NTE family protein